VRLLGEVSVGHEQVRAERERALGEIFADGRAGRSGSGGAEGRGCSGEAGRSAAARDRGRPGAMAKSTRIRIGLGRSMRRR
jgi:hypothetical protein